VANWEAALGGGHDSDSTVCQLAEAYKPTFHLCWQKVKGVMKKKK